MSKKKAFIYLRKPQRKSASTGSVESAFGSDSNAAFLGIPISCHRRNSHPNKAYGKQLQISPGYPVREINVEPPGRTIQIPIVHCDKYDCWMDVPIHVSGNSYHGFVDKTDITFRYTAEIPGQQPPSPPPPGMQTLAEYVGAIRFEFGNNTTRKTSHDIALATTSGKTKKVFQIAAGRDDPPPGREYNPDIWEGLKVGTDFFDHIKISFVPDPGYSNTVVRIYSIDIDLNNIRYNGEKMVEHDFISSGAILNQSGLRLDQIIKDARLAKVAGSNANPFLYTAAQEYGKAWSPKYCAQPHDLDEYGRPQNCCNQLVRYVMTENNISMDELFKTEGHNRCDAHFNLINWLEDQGRWYNAKNNVAYEDLGNKKYVKAGNVFLCKDGGHDGFFIRWVYGSFDPNAIYNEFEAISNTARLTRVTRYRVYNLIRVPFETPHFPQSLFNDKNSIYWGGTMEYADGRLMIAKPTKDGFGKPYP